MFLTTFHKLCEENPKYRVATVHSQNFLDPYPKITLSNCIEVVLFSCEEAAALEQSSHQEFYKLFKDDFPDRSSCCSHGPNMEFLMPETSVEVKNQCWKH